MSDSERSPSGPRMTTSRAITMATPYVNQVPVVPGTTGTWFTYGVAMVIALLVVILGPLGDLSESLMKRDYGVKDMGKLIPGHCGIMDRFDSTFFTAPAVFYFLFYFVLRN